MDHCVAAASPTLQSQSCTISAEGLAQVVQSLQSPRVTPKKRALPVELEAIDSAVSKHAKRTAPSKEGNIGPKNKLLELIDLDEAVKTAIGFYKELWTLQTIEEECGYPQDEDAREDRSGAACEEWAKQNYEAIRAAANALLPWAGGLKPVAEANYDVLQFQGVKPPGLKKNPYAKKETKDEEQQIRDYRNSTKQARAREALLTICSALSCRREKLWSELSESDLIDMVKKSGLRRVKSRKMLALIKHFIHDEVEKGNWCCQFASALVRAESYIRIACARGPGYSIPASILIVHRMPLWNVFLKMEDDTPFCGAAARQAWWKHSGREVALQELDFAAGEDPDMNKERFPASTLKPNPAIKRLLQSQTPVVYLDILAALSTREASKKYGLSDVVKGELAMLFREAKTKKEAVIFVLGTDDPRKLAEKVYLRPPLSDFGLKCGFLRWRASPDEPWAREKEYSDRSTFMLQMP